MEQIGKELSIYLQQEVEVERIAERFRVLTYRICPTTHEIDAEVSLHDSGDKVIGGSRWVRLNPIVKMEDDIDNWGTLKSLRISELTEQVKLRLIEECGGKQGK